MCVILCFSIIGSRRVTPDRSGRTLRDEESIVSAGGVKTALSGILSRQQHDAVRKGFLTAREVALSVTVFLHGGTADGFRPTAEWV